MPRYVWIVLALLLVSQANADDAFLEAAKDLKARDIEAAQAQVEECAERLKAAVKDRDAAGVKKARGDMAAASKELSRARNKKLSDYLEQSDGDGADGTGSQVAKRQENERKAITPGDARARLRKIGPLFIQDAAVVTNVIGLPELTFVVRNTGSSAVEAFDIEALCFNSFDEPVKGIPAGNVFSEACTTVVRPGEEKQMSIQLSLHRGTTRAVMRITRAKLGSGEVWEQSLEQAKEIPGAIFEAKRPK